MGQCALEGEGHEEVAEARDCQDTWEMGQENTDGKEIQALWRALSHCETDDTTRDQIFARATVGFAWWV